MTHTEIASWLSSEHGVLGWWAQGLTVRFEQEIGRRQPGQNCEGDYTVGVSATLVGSMDEALARWAERFEGWSEFNGVEVAEPPVATQSPKWRYWKVRLKDGTRVNVNISNKSEGRALLQVQHEKLPDEAAIEGWRAYWKDILKKL